ncbi:MAG: MBL fold metallo-hydrolase [Erysipelotrichales bacterium]|nr:MBL fold metallo-hydrolase [Erysipelotrichales bacterium]MBQ4374196.1 MBL fold metallo-hydrolase [Erysipelotrichales bacterium]
MTVDKIPAGVFQANCYIVKEGHDVVIIDPGAYRKVSSCLSLEEDDKVRAILLTHGHFDHIGGVDRLQKDFGCPVYLSKEDEELARSERINSMGPYSCVLHCALKDFPSGTLRFGNLAAEVMYTPGHTEGSVCFKIGNHLFTGDTLFHRSVGRTDLYGGSDTKLRQSLRMLSALDPNLILHPGHEEDSTLEEELKHNPYL